MKNDVQVGATQNLYQTSSKDANANLYEYIVVDGNGVKHG